MPTYSKQYLSNSSNGKTIQLTLSTAPGTLIHTTGASAQDEVWLYASNSTGVTSTTTSLSNAADSITTFFWGSTGMDGVISQTLVQAYAGATLIIPGLLLSNSNSIYAFTQYPSAVNITGYVNRIT